MKSREEKSRVEKRGVAVVTRSELNGSEVN